MDVYTWSAQALSRALQRREVSVREVVAATLARIAEVDPHLHAFLHVAEAQAYAQAEAAQARLDAGEAPPLCGVPVALKDNLSTRDMPTTCASRMLAGYCPPFDATVVARLKAQGAILIGKTNLDEFAMGSSTENSAFGPTRNPWDLERVPGGSSGGSAAAVAAGEAPLALGSDTGGSIRQPAAFCGVVGLKPTYGRVSRFGLVAFASSLDQIGPFARDVADAALLLEAIAGHDDLDATCVAEPVPPYSARLGAEVKGLRIGLPRQHFGAGIDESVKAAVRQAIEQLARLGADIVEVDLPHTEYALATYYLIAPAEASSNLARYDGVRYGLRVEAGDSVAMFKATRAQGFGAEVKRRILLGTYALSAGYYDAYYLRALKVRRLIKGDFDAAFASCDVLAAPTTPTPPFRAGEKTSDPMQMYMSDLCTIPANLAGIPAISVPCAFSDAGLPIGLQLMAPAFGELRLLQVAHALEQTLALAPRVAPGRPSEDHAHAKRGDARG